jgi:prolyl oligopeptidase
MDYPLTRKDAVVDDYFGTPVADPYRWLEDPNSPETRAWVEAQNAITHAFLERLPARDRIHRRLTELWDYIRYGVPSREGRWYVFARNDGLQNQAVIYKAAALDAPPEVLIDPNLLSSDGAVALGTLSFSHDGRFVAYSVSAGGSDWVDWRVRDVASATDLPDVVRWSKFSGAAWLHDSSGFFYGRYAAPAEGDTYSGVNKHQQVYFHALGTTQDEDRLVYARPDQPDWGFAAGVTDDGRYLVLTQWEGTHRESRIFVRDLQDPRSEIVPFLDRFDASYAVVGNDGPVFYVVTDKDAGRNRMVTIALARPGQESWTDVIPELPGQDVLSGAVMIGQRFLTVVRSDAHDRLLVYSKTGLFEAEIRLPTLGSIAGVHAKRDDREAFYAFTAFTHPTTIYRHDPDTGVSTIFKAPEARFTPGDYETTQVFYSSKDGTAVPMFLVHRRDVNRRGELPTLLYGYGGFDVSLTPQFSPGVLAWLDMGGLYAQPNLRGGGEYGKAWHDAGRLANRQNVFDDFIAAAEYLIEQGYTNPARLAINGGSNGGLLVGAVMTQRPDLFAAAVPQVGVLDMLRFHRFTIGWAWTSDYGSSDTRDGFETLMRYSPLHNITPGTAYPATLVTTADHDDRVVPAHSHKFTATLQAAQAGDAPILARIDTRAGHGAGKPTTKQIDERADVFAFLAHILQMDV